jgi:hypothetical protein
MYYRVILQEEFLWQQFNSLGNEMIITRSGRCLFPLFRISFEPHPSLSSSIFNCVDIKETGLYRVGVFIEQLDWMKWRYREGQWQPILGGFNDTAKSMIKLNGEGNKNINNNFANGNSGGSLAIYEPFETPRKGEDLVESGVSFAKLKLVNRSSSSISSSIALTGEGMGNGSKDRKYRSIASLHSFHRYRPLIYIKEAVGSLPFTWNGAQKVF